MDHRTQLCRLRHSKQWGDQCYLRRRSQPAWSGPILVHRGSPQSDDLLYCADGHPGFHEVGRRSYQKARFEFLALAWFGGRAHQPRGLEVVLQSHWRRSLPDRGHLVADGNGRDYDHNTPRSRLLEAWIRWSALFRGGSEGIQ